MWTFDKPSPLSISTWFINDPPLNNYYGVNTNIIFKYSAGDFGGHLHMWEIEIRNSSVNIKKYHHTQVHKSHVVCLQVNARRIVSGSRDKSVLVQDYWASVTKKQ